MKRFTKTLAAVLTQSVVTAVIGVSIGGTAYGAEDSRVSLMNQAGAYEQTLAFYLHPAHGFPGAANNNMPHPAVLMNRKGADPMYAFTGHFVGHAAIGDSRANAYGSEAVMAQRTSHQPNAALLSHPAAASPRTAMAQVR